MKIIDLKHGLFKIDREPNRLFLKLKQNPLSWEVTHGLFALEFEMIRQKMIVKNIFTSGVSFPEDIVPVSLKFSCPRGSQGTSWKFFQLTNYEAFALYYKEFNKWSLDRQTLCVKWNSWDFLPNNTTSYAIDVMNGYFIMNRPDHLYSVKQMKNNPVERIDYMRIVIPAEKTVNIKQLVKEAV